jgi:hypothetical protein
MSATSVGRSRPTSSGEAGRWSWTTASRGEIQLTDGAPTGQIARLTVGSLPPTGTDAAFKNLDEPLGWCVSLTDPAGQVGAFKYTQLAGLEQGTCA